MLHSNYPRLITSKASVINTFLLVQVDIYTCIRSVLVNLIALASNIYIEVNEKLINSVQLAANQNTN